MGQLGQLTTQSLQPPQPNMQQVHSCPRIVSTGTVQLPSHPKPPPGIFTFAHLSFLNKRVSQCSVLENVRQRQQRRCQEILVKYFRRKFLIFCRKFLSKLCLQRLKFTTTISRIKLLLNLSI